MRSFGVACASRVHIIFSNQRTVHVCFQLLKNLNNTVTILLPLIIISMILIIITSNLTNIGGLRYSTVSTHRTNYIRFRSKWPNIILPATSTTKQYQVIPEWHISLAHRFHAAVADLSSTARRRSPDETLRDGGGVGRGRRSRA